MDDNSLRERNIQRCRKILEKFAPFEQDWLDEMHPQLCMEFRFGAGVGMPDRIEGYHGCTTLLQSVSEKFGLTFFGVEVLGMADPNLVLAEYEGNGHFDGMSYDQKYISVLGFKDEKLILFREYMDTQVIADGPGHLSVLG